MKKVNIRVLGILATGIMLSSCAAFRGGHERCPAYGSNVKADESKELNYAQESATEIESSSTLQVQE